MALYGYNAKKRYRLLARREAMERAVRVEETVEGGSVAGVAR
jgi:hypothetical protein